MPTTKMQRRPFMSGLTSALSRDIDQFQGNIRRMFENPFTTAEALAPFAQPLQWMPAVEISESPSEVTLTAELAGMDPKDVHVQLDGDVLTLQGEKLAERKEGEQGTEYYLVERGYGSFQRSFSLPSMVDADKINAEFDKGVLTVHMPKTAQARSRGREIPVNGGGTK